jgi:hypothetical protein
MTMAKPINISCDDSHFDPREPILVNGYLFIPAGAAEPSFSPTRPLDGKLRQNKVVVEMKRRKLVERT